MTTTSSSSAALSGGATRNAAWRIVLLLCLINIINFLDKSALGLVAVPIREEYGLTPSQFGMIGSAFFLVFAVSAAGLSWLGNRFSPRWLLFGMVILWSVLQLPIAVSGSVALLVVARMALAMVEAPSLPLSQMVLHQWFPDKLRQTPTMVFHASGPIGAILVIPILTVLIALLGWRSLFFVLAVAGIVVAILWGLFSKNGPVTDTNAHNDTTTAAPPQAAVPYRTILRSGTFLGAAAALFVAQWSIAVGSAWIPAYFEEGLGFDAGDAGVLVAVMYVFITVGLILYGVVSQRRSARGIASREARVLPLATMMVVAAVIVIGSTLIGIPLVSALVLGLGLSLAQGGFGIGTVVLGEIVPQAQRAAVIGIMVTLGAVGAILAPTVFGFLVESSSTTLAGYHHAWWLTAVVFVVMAFAITRLIRTDRDGAIYAAAAARRADSVVN
ncbi:transmembrane transport [Ascochyta rabiei]|uniref:Transmembrane transport n=1 Tax=Didymella rabiei TaxID=5454 RepID=A0A163LQ20_DIDRA|nr:transmembrane transport [Ascochyta rabiei]